MKKDKEYAVSEFEEMIKNSWTYARLTADEQKRLSAFFSEVDCYDRVKGSYESRWEQCHLMYQAFLTALDYQAIGWREPGDDESPKF